MRYISIKLLLLYDAIYITLFVVYLLLLHACSYMYMRICHNLRRLIDDTVFTLINYCIILNYIPLYINILYAI